MVENKQQKVLARTIWHHNDSSGDIGYRYVFSNVSGADLHLSNRWGQPLPVFIGNHYGDSICYTYHNIYDSLNKSVFKWVYEGKSFFYEISPTGDFQLSSPECNKPGRNILTLWPDTANVIVWHNLNIDKGFITFYQAIENYHYPYYNKQRVDSFTYNLKTFCTVDERIDEHKMRQELYEKYIKIKVTPNPFIDKFELTMQSGPMGFMIQSAQKTIRFYDDKGKTLLEQFLIADQPTSFSFPNIKPGTILRYSITWDDFELTGKISKML
ncbi:MAG: hypothetical protein V4613_04940 [Bacteroidota bacterium]